MLFKMKVTLTVLSEYPMDNLSLERLCYEADYGDAVMNVEREAPESLTAEQMREELIKAGNDGTFFDYE